MEPLVGTLAKTKPLSFDEQLDKTLVDYAPDISPVASAPMPQKTASFDDQLDSALKDYAPQPTASENLADAGRLFLQGTADVGGAIGWGLEKSGIAPETGKTLRESAGENQERLQGRMTPEMQAASQQPLLDADNNINPNFDWRSLAANVIPSIPGSIAMGVGSAPLAGALGLAGKAAGKAIAGEAGATLGNFVGTGAGYGAGEGIFSAASNAGQWVTEQEKTPTADFALKNANNPNWQSALAASNGDAEAAKAAMIKQGGDDIFWDTAWKTGALSTVTGGGMFGGMTRRVAGETAEGFGKSIAKDFLAEAGQEAPQSFFENKTTNQAIHDYVDPTQDVNEGNINAGVLGGISGGVMGAVGGGASSLVKVRGPLTQALATNPGAIEEGLRRQEQQRLAAEAAANEENSNGSGIQPNNSNTGTDATGQPGQQPTAGPLVGGLNNLSQPTDNGGLNAGTTTNTGTTENTGPTDRNTGAGGIIPSAEQEIGAATGQDGQSRPENNTAAGEAGAGGSDNQQGVADLTDQDLQDTIDFLNQRRGAEQDPEALLRIDNAMSIYSNELNQRLTNANTQEAPQNQEASTPVPEPVETATDLQATNSDAAKNAAPEDLTNPPLTQQEDLQNEETSQNATNENAPSTGQETEGLLNEGAAPKTDTLGAAPVLEDTQNRTTNTQTFTQEGINEQTNSKIEAQTQAEAPGAPTTGGVEAYAHLAEKGFTPDEIAEVAQQPADKVQSWARGRFGKERATGIEFTPQPVTPTQDQITGMQAPVTGMQAPVTGKPSTITPTQEQPTQFATSQQAKAEIKANPLYTPATHTVVNNTIVPKEGVNIPTDVTAIVNTQAQPNNKGGWKLINTATGKEVFDGASFSSKSEGSKLLNALKKQATQPVVQAAQTEALATTRPAKYEHKDFKTFTAMAEIEVDGETQPAKEFIKKVQSKKSALQDFIKCVGGG